MPIYKQCIILFLCGLVNICTYGLSIAEIVVSPDKITICQTNNHGQNPPATVDLINNTFPVPYLFSAPTNTLQKAISNNNYSSKRRNIHVHMSQLKYASKVNCNIFPDLHRVVSRKRIAFRQADDFTWFGASKQTNHIDTILTIKGSALYGNIILDNQTYQILPVAPPLHQIAMIDPSKFPSEHIPLETQLCPIDDIDQVSYHQADDGNTVHIMVVYTPKAARESYNIHGLIQLAVDETNVSYETSNIHMRLNLVHTHQVQYQEQDIVKDLEHLTFNNDGFMDEVHTLRDMYCADIVVLIESSDNYCGVSFLNPEASHGFCVVSNKCATGYFSFGHEIGHLFGARHNPEIDPKRAPYPYGHGYLHVNGWRTIMAYNDPMRCPNGTCQRILQWSNPGIRYQNTYTGTFSTHNNARLLNENALKVANFRYFGEGFTVCNHDDHPVTIHTIRSSSPWMTILPQSECPFQINATHSKSFKVHVDWDQIDTTQNGNIEINDHARVEIIAIPLESVPVLAVEPLNFTCDKNIVITDIHVGPGHENIQWQAFSRDPWLSIIDGHRGMGDGTVRIRVARNLLGMRTGTVEIVAINSQKSSKTVTIAQWGNPLSIDIPQKVEERDGLLVDAGKIHVPTVLKKHLTISLSVSDTSLLLVPEYVVITENEKSANFSIQVIDNSKSEGPQTAIVSAQAEGWLCGNAEITILDDEKDGVIYVGNDQKYKTIGNAMVDAAPDSAILVLSGTYKENLTITKPLHLYSANGPAQTFIQGTITHKHVIEIAQSRSTVEGFTIHGASNCGKAAIYLASTASHCLIKNNICGQDQDNHNYYGIYVDTGGNHTISHNLCHHNKRYGIYLDQSSSNTLVKNTCQFNQRTGIYLFQSQNNMIYKNIIKYHPKYGMNFKYSNNNFLFLNTFIANDTGHLESEWSVNIWQNPVPVNHHFGQGFVGNYFDDHPCTDHNDDGIADKFYSLPNEEPQEEFPLSVNPSEYDCQTQIINAQNQLVSDEMPEMQSQCLCASGQTVQFISSPDRYSHTTYTKQDTWTGNIQFVSPIHTNHQFRFQLGMIDHDRNFIKSGPPQIFVGDGKSSNFRFCIFPGAFTIDAAYSFAFQITNESPEDYNILIGSGHTQISSYRHVNENPLAWKVGKNETFRSIQFALSTLFGFQQLSKGNAYTLTVMPGSYTENIQVTQPAALISHDGYTKTFISARRSDHHVVHIHSDNVTLKGFTIYGADQFNASGLCIDRGIAGSWIENNRLGWDSKHTNDHGIIVCSSIKNMLINNQCLFNEKHGIWLDTAFMNHLKGNFCFQNQASGIYLTNALLNQLEHNICENNNHKGIHLVRSSRNQLQFNICDANSQDGLFMDAESFNNRVYLNNFVLNEQNNVHSCGINQWSSSRLFRYQYKGHVHAGQLGNYYNDNTWQDMDYNGVIDMPYEINGTDYSDGHALVHPYSFYTFIHEDEFVPVLRDPGIEKISKTTLGQTAPHIETRLITSTVQPDDELVNKSSNFIQLEQKTSKPAKKRYQSVQPVLVLTDVPAYGNRLKNLKGLVLNASPEAYHIAVYIHIKGQGWCSKPYPSQPMTLLAPDGRWECDITTAAFDQKADIIVAVLYALDKVPPVLMNAPVLPDSIFENGVGFVRNLR